MDTQHPDLHPLYADHLATLERRSEAALERGGFDHLVVPSGQLHYQFLDDRDYPFCVNPHFKHWLPVTKAPGSWLVYTPGQRPRLIYLQPHDYWHVVPEAPAGYWVEHFDITLIRTAEEARAHLPKNLVHCAVIGEANAAVDDFVPNNPQAVIDYLHYQRACKTPYELAMLRVANRIAVRGHRAAEAAFRAGESEFGIHVAYVQATRQTDNELPYTNIIGLNEHAAVLHYMHLDHAPPARPLSFLIDAGASFHGYAADITRTYAHDRNDEFQVLVEAVDAAQRNLCARVRAGQDYRDLHVQAHLALAGILRDNGFIRLSPEAAVETGISSVFFPHGLGHGIGLQVHDVAGFAADDRGGTIARPDGHPYLRLTRRLEPGMVVTIEPGLYFIDMLLATLKDKPAARDIDWVKVDRFRRYGGIRIEDDVACTDGEPENLTRGAFAAPSPQLA
ncbi:MAG TPA: Xaa-Pro dipeptidase [Dokdonella sp.]|uniref:Xaa-Pro dipeptidase n=1 Tax=Dokdonella sp. TaxID=2291710 RepID=UPI0025BDF90B|nr:Xaa-Pro dipeptidase [Dokdonella sp.]MBX3691831.1 Xaa-Pro dipeptidase [Dokdonella sp.]MCW5568940.1 Xaa-Pro dipeptidase [Dokdonella sp.]HNR92381.1 Xaa-Pro dipeptidase [Dokdonella sp.]